MKELQELSENIEELRSSNVQVLKDINELKDIYKALIEHLNGPYNMKPRPFEITPEQYLSYLKSINEHDTAGC